MRKLYLHMGAHRTATSTVQSAMRRNFDGLLAQGYLYPYGVRRHHQQINALFSGNRTPAEFAADLLQRAEDKEVPVGAIVISDEDISMRRDLSPLVALKDSFDVHVVYSLRRQDLWLESWYLQNVKWQWNRDYAHLSLQAFLARRRDFFWIEYEAFVEGLVRAFGRDRVILTVFESEQMPRGPVAAFCEAIGVHPTEKILSSPSINSSLSPVMSEFMRQLPLDTAPDKYRRQLEQACIAVDRALMKSETERSQLLLDPQERAALLAEYEPGNAALARDWFGRDRLFQAALPPADATLGQMTLPADSAALMSRIVEPFVRALIAQNKKPAK